ncbi:hypothetical protein QTO34_018257 [Cnephaeus nilssonii]|uniref:Uncharacterized protein n=1 Tax=Cnephaeus nilssonii TaxID=3371016 RepID=A0AA40HZH3_CNENI|nr:hypothetical protein QTO34_018257 [Eptesicus nilssonii]
MPREVADRPGTPGSGRMGPATPPQAADCPRDPREGREGPGHAPPGGRSPAGPLGGVGRARPRPPDCRSSRYLLECLGSQVSPPRGSDLPRDPRTKRTGRRHLDLLNGRIGHPESRPPASRRPNRGRSGGELRCAYFIDVIHTPTL